MVAANAARRLSDPLTAALQPPSNETDAQREARLASEREAKKVSDGIDEQLRQEKEALKAKARSRQEIKVLLLGQSESGKSTTLKRMFLSPFRKSLLVYISPRHLEFQLAYVPNAFRQERLAWRPVVYLNLVRSLRRILDALSPPELQSFILDDDDTASIRHRDSISESNRPPTASTPTNSVFVSPKYAELRAQLQPLLDLEQDLVKRLSAGDDDEATQLAAAPVPSSPRMNPKSEVAVNNRINWKKALNKFTSKNNNGTDLSFPM